MGINDFQVQNIHLLTSYHYVYLQINSLYTLLLLHTSSVPATPVVAAEPSYVCLTRVVVIPAALLRTFTTESPPAPGLKTSSEWEGFFFCH